MSTDQDDHSISRVRTFRTDVDAARLDPHTDESTLAEQAKKPPVHHSTHTPSKVVDAAALGGAKDAKTYLQAVSGEVSAPDLVVATPAAVIEPKAAPAEGTTPLITEPPAKAELPVPEPEPTPATTLSTDNLSAEIETLNARTKKSSLLSDTDAVYDTDDDGIETGTIIQDKRRERKGFSHALFTLAARWFKKTSDALTAPPEDVREVPVPLAEMSAAPQSDQVAVAPKDDFVTVVKERVRAVKAEKDNPALVIKDKTESTETSSWTHIKEGEATRAEPDPIRIPVTTAATPLPPLTNTDTDTTALSGGPMWRPATTEKSRVAVSKPATHTDARKRVSPKPLSFEPVHSTHTQVAEVPLPPPQPIEPKAPLTATVERATPPRTTNISTEPIITPPPTPAAIASPAPQEPELVTAPEPVPEWSHEAELVALKNDPEIAPTESIVAVAEADTGIEEPTHVALQHESEPAAPEPELVTAPAPLQTAAVIEPPFGGPKSPAGFRRLEIREGIRAAKNAPTNSLAVGIMVVLAFVGAGIFASFHLLTTTVIPNPTITIAQPPALIVVTEQIPLPLTTDRADLLKGVLAQITEKQSTIQVYPTALSPRGRDEAADAATILEVLDLRVDGSFTRSVADITFGGTGGAEPFILLRTSQFDAAFAGMLGWEQFMSADLTPLFGEVVVSTLDPQARTAGSERASFFTDGIIANRSGRILYDELGLERIVYVFVDQETILITTTRGAVERLVPLIR